MFGKMHETFALLNAAFETKPSQPILVWGMDGCGKSRGIEAFIQTMKNDDGTPVKYWFLNGNSMEQTDIAGLFARGDDGEWSRVPVLRAIKEAMEENAQGRQFVFVMEEFTTMLKPVMAPCLSFISEKIVGDERLDENLIHIVALANPPEIAVNPTNLAPPVATRFLHIHWEMDFAFWSKNMMEGKWFPGTQEAAADVISFLHSKGTPEAAGFANHSGFAQDPSREFMNKPRGNPRTWSNLIKMDTVMRLSSVSIQVREKAFRGHVGEALGREFGAWVRMQMEGLSVVDALQNPDAVNLPTRADKQFAFFNGVAARVSGTLDLTEYHNAWSLLGRAPNKDTAALAAQTLSGLLQGNKHLLKNGIPRDALAYASMMSSVSQILSQFQK